MNIDEDLNRSLTPSSDSSIYETKENKRKLMQPMLANCISNIKDLQGNFTIISIVFLLCFYIS